MTSYIVIYEVMDGDIGLIIEEIDQINVQTDAWSEINCALHKIDRNVKIISFVAADVQLITDFC